MPVRRKRTKVQQTSRKRPVLPEGDLETSMNDEERRQKLEVYLQDFDGEVRSRIKKMRSKANALNNTIRNAYKLGIFKFPAHIRKMKMVDYLEQGGIVDDTKFEEASKIVTNMTDAVFQNAPRPPIENLTNTGNLQTPAKSKRKRGKQAQGTAPAPNGRVLRSDRKRKNVDMSPSSSRKEKTKARKTDTAAMPPPLTSTARSTRKNSTKVNQFATPAAYGRDILQTPFVTPKFDPRLPMTPALLREAKAGERIMSLSGSPLTNTVTSANMTQVFIPIGNGKTFQFTTDCHLSPSQAPSLTGQARKNVELLQEQLSRLLKVPSKLLKK